MGCKVLLERGADVNAVDDSYGNTPLHRCVAPDDLKDICELLLQNKADVNARTKKGQTALHKAAAYGSIECVKVLLENSADASLVDAEGNTALHAAAGSLENSWETVALLMTKGHADKDARNLKGQRPIDISLAKGNDDLVEFLQ